MENTLWRKRAVLSLIVFMVVTRIPVYRIEVLGQVPTNEDRITSAIRGLWSPNEDQRQGAKAEIIKIGEKAMPALLSLLGDLIRKPEAPRFATGKENEGEELWRSLDSAPLQLDQVRHLMDLDISWRLSADVCEMLGRLRAIEAVPLLLQIMEVIEIYDRMAAMSFEMKALIEIGKPAVPLIVELFEAADLRAESIRFGEPHPPLEDQITYKRGHAATIRARAAVVLGQIGSRQALPALEKSLQSSTPLGWRPDVPYIEEAIRKIKNKHQTRVQ